jgi:two-component system, NarL family, sensor histidine kinase UhpB
VVVIPAVMLILGLLGTVGVVLLNAQGRIAAEITSAMELGHDLAASALHNVADADSPVAALERLRQDLPRVRHVKFEIVSVDGILSRGIGLPGSQHQPESRSWIARLLAPAPITQSFPVVVHGVRIGELRMISDSASEIAEIIGEVELFVGALVALGLLLIGGLLWAVHRSLRPLQALAEGFDRLERRDYRPIAPIAVRELQKIAYQFNHLAQTLQQVTQDNHFLIDKLLSLQDQERQALASDLHDEFGSALFGIRADATCIMRSVPSGTEAHARAQSIAELADGIQKVNYRILDRLRPLVLEQMGLCQALRQQVNTWRATYPRHAWFLHIPQDFDDPAEATSLTLYRAAQESVINAVRHAQASTISISLQRQTANEAVDAIAVRAARSVFLSVRDDGRGLPANFRAGFGLLGLTERVRLRGGILTIRETHPGVAIEVTIPEEQQHPTVESAHADSVDRGPSDSQNGLPTLVASQGWNDGGGSGYRG